MGVILGVRVRVGGGDMQRCDSGIGTLPSTYAQVYSTSLPAATYPDGRDTRGMKYRQFQESQITF